MPALVGQEHRRLLRPRKAAYKASFTDSIQRKDRRDGMSKALHLKALHGLVLVNVLEAVGAAHPDDAALYLGTPEALGMTMTRYIKLLAMPDQLNRACRIWPWSGWNCDTLTWRG